MAPHPLHDYIQASLEAYLVEDFQDITRPIRGSLPSSEPEPHPSASFNVKELQRITEPQEMLSYISSTLGRMKIGEGEGRAVYKLGNGKVLKVAKNPGGQGQNQAEASVCADGSITRSLFPQVSLEGPGYMWLVVEEAASMTREAFQQLTGLPWKKFISALKGAFVQKARNVSEYDKQNFIDLSNNPFFSTIMRVIKECKYEPGDIAKLDSWGVVKGKPVIIDSGFTEAVNHTYYKGAA